MASNAISEITEEFLVCQVCLEDYKQPKMLPCLHTFCQPCLERLLATEPVGKLSCPTCRQDVPLPKNGVQCLKDNFLVSKLHDILKQQQKEKGETSHSQEDKVTCTACEVGNLALFYCAECSDNLCQPCKDAHSRLRATRSHDIITVKQSKSKTRATQLRERETSKCTDHNELDKFYCDTCHQIICEHCVVMTHKDHEYVEIEKAAEKKRAKIKSQLSTVKNATDLHEKWMQQLRSVKDEWSSQVHRTEGQIGRQAKASIKALEKVKNDMISQLRAMDAARKKQAAITMEAAEMDLASAKSCIQFTDNVLEYGSPAEVMSVAGELTGRLGRILDDKIAEKFRLTEAFMDLTFDPPAGQLEEEVGKIIGGIKKTTVRIEETKVRRPVTLLPGRPNVTIGKDDVSPEPWKTVERWESKDRQFEIPSSLAVTAEGGIVGTDHENKCLQFLDRDGVFQKKVNLTFKPRCVTAMANGDLLMTGDGHKIHVLDKQGRESRVIEVPGSTEKDETTRGIAVDSLGRIIVTIGYQVFVLGPKGDMCKFGDKREGHYHLSSYLQVAVNGSNQIIISDEWNNLKIFEPAGRHLRTLGSSYGRGRLSHPHGVITDSEDNIIVADCFNYLVALFSKDGTFIRDLLTQKEHGLLWPEGLAFTHDGHLVVSDKTSVKFFLVT